MQTIDLDTAIKQGKKNFSNQNTFDYSDILKSYGLAYCRFRCYWQVGEINDKRGWVLYLSVIRLQLIDLLISILPELISEKVSFMVVQNITIAESHLSGATGYFNLGKLITIYPSHNSQAVRLSQILINLTKPYRGPAIPTSKHLGGNVYTQYVDFTKLNDPHDHSNFSLPLGVEWPFTKIATATDPKSSKLLNYAYYPVSVIKPDAKGDVLKALYFRKPWQIKACLIKQGRKDCFVDEAGRDIRARLQWQYDLYQKLKGDIPMPKIYSLFTKGEDLYLCMEFIKGISLAEWLSIQYQSNSWKDLRHSVQAKLLNCLLQVLGLIERMHKKGYLHRDISPENFLITKSNQIYLIDLELSWCSTTELPSPPFQQGTPGFIAPEKYTNRKPAIQEDIFALGGLMVVFFTNLSPLKFSDNLQQKNEILNFLIGDSALAQCISKCMAPEPEKRPKIPIIMDMVRGLRDRLQVDIKEKMLAVPVIDTPLEGIDNIIKAAIASLSSSQLLSPNNCWFSLNHTPDEIRGNEQLTVAAYPGWFTGMAGPMWVLSLAKRIGLPIDNCNLPYKNSLEFLHKRAVTSSAPNLPGLYNGLPGIGRTISDGQISGLNVLDQELLESLYKCFSVPYEQFNLSKGIAGQGIALLNSAHILDKPFVNKALAQYLNLLVQDQLLDGCWNLLYSSKHRKDIPIGIDEGVAGIVWFLLCSLEYQPEARVLQSCMQALNWIISKARQKTGLYYWHTSTESKTIKSLNSSVGTTGVILTLIKGYEILDKPIYREIAEAALLSLQPRPVLSEFGLSEGLAGLGEVYLEAYRVFNNPLWRERTSWIVNLLVRTYKDQYSGELPWRAGTGSITTADLSNGISGILHFLLKFRYNNRIRHYLDPISIFDTK